MLDILTLQASSPNPTLLTVLYTVLVSFLLSSLIGLTYIKTFKGLSFSMGYVQALILSSIVAATVMQAIGDSLARGLGMLGALAIIRFRTNFKDARDIIFMFAALAAGIGCGVGGYTIALVGTGGFVAVALLLSFTNLGRASYFDGMLRFNMESTEKSRAELERLMQAYCDKFALITLREVAQGKRLDYAYHVKLRGKKDNEGFIGELRQIPSIQGVSLMLQETTVEL
jgi:uncharacterized membrane protein YhiD involved in acid resistance